VRHWAQAFNRSSPSAIHADRQAAGVESAQRCSAGGLGPCTTPRRYDCSTGTVRLIFFLMSIFWLGAFMVRRLRRFCTWLMAACTLGGSWRTARPSETPATPIISARRERCSDDPHIHLEEAEPDHLISQTVAAQGGDATTNVPFIHRADDNMAAIPAHLQRDFAWRVAMSSNSSSSFLHPEPAAVDLSWMSGARDANDQAIHAYYDQSLRAHPARFAL
jgi:hypothetical protein